MADATIEREWKHVDKRITQATVASPNGTTGNYGTQSVLDARLLAIGGVYTQAFLNKMTKNDKTYAVRVHDDPTGI